MPGPVHEEEKPQSLFAHTMDLKVSQLDLANVKWSKGAIMMDL
jgi:hypothetical protein